MKIDDFQQALLEAAAKKGFTAAEVYIAGGRSLEVRVFEEQVSHYESSMQRGISFRGQYNGKMGYAFSEKTDADLIAWMLDQAAGNAEVLSDNENEDLFAGEPWQPADSFSEKLALLEPAALIHAARQLEKGAKEADPRIRAVEYAISEYVESERMIANTLGLSVQDKTNLAFAYAVARAQTEDSLKKGVEFWQGRDFGTLDAAGVGAGAAARAVSLLGAKTIKSGSMPVILDQRAAADLLKAFLPIFFADKIQQGFSLLGPKLGQAIAAPCVSLTDDAHYVSSLYQPPFDSEGVSTKKTSLLEEGILHGFLHNRKTAAKAGCQSTGNGFRPSWKAGIQIAATNSFIQPGDLSKNELQKKLDRGLLITELTGLHAGTNLTSGDFSLSAEGFWLENGETAYPVEQITVAGNFYELLRQVKAVANDLFFDLPGGGQVGSPSLLIDALSISGQ